jgi:hypothetical protein
MGRPTKYREEYCEQLIDHMAKGYSFESFAGLIRTCKQTLYTWLEKHPDFMDAKSVGNMVSLHMWETIGISGSMGKLRGFNAAAYKFNKKNRFPNEWRDRHEISYEDQNDLEWER